MASELKERLGDQESGAQFLVNLKQSVADFKQAAKTDMEKCDSRLPDPELESPTAGTVTEREAKRLRRLILGDSDRKKNEKKKKKRSESESDEESEERDNDSEDNEDEDDDEDARSSKTWKLEEAGELQLKQIRKERAKSKRKEKEKEKDTCYKLGYKDIYH